MAYSTVTLTGHYLNTDGVTPAKGTVLVVPSVPKVVDTTGAVILSGTVARTLDATGTFSVTLPATDDATLSPNGFGYTVLVHLAHQSFDPVSLALPAAVPTVNIKDVVSVDPATFVTPNFSDAQVAALVQNTGGVGPLTSAALTTTFAPVINVKKYGAVGNGTTDDTAAFQAAINALPLNPAADGILSPADYANGGTLFIPKGRFVVSSTLNLHRGVRIVGEGRESSQIISKTAGSVIRYADAGRYIQDEIVIENLSIWQHSSVTATSGAAIDVGFGPASVQSTKLICRNVYVEKTYEGYLLEAGVASTFENCDASQCVSHGFNVRYTDGVQSVTTTSTSFISCYASLNGGDGFHATRGSYLNWTACASDSNAGYGYYLDATAGAFIQGGCEENTTGGVYLKDTEGITLSVNVIHAAGSSAKHGVTFDNARTTALVGGYLSAGASITGYALHQAVSGGPVTVIATSFVGPYSTNKADFTAKFLHLTGGFGLVGDTNNWAIGTAQSPDPLAVFNVGGLADSDSDAGLKANVTHTGAGGARNSAALVQALTANTAVTYALLLGLYVPAASKGAASTVTRQAGVYIAEASTGATANAALAIDAGTGTVPAGNWAIYSDSVRDSVFKGPLRMGSTTGPTWRTGAGTPEGVISAVVGSLYTRTDGGAATTLYVKETGSGNTGWVAK